MAKCNDDDKVVLLLGVCKYSIHTLAYTQTHTDAGWEQ